MPPPGVFVAEALYNLCNLLLSFRELLRGEFAECFLLLISVCILAMRDTFTLILFWLMDDWQERMDPEERSCIMNLLQDVLSLIQLYSTARAWNTHQASPPQTPIETTTHLRRDAFSAASTQVEPETELLTHNGICKREIARIIPISDESYFQRHVANALGQSMPAQFPDEPCDVQDLSDIELVEQVEAEHPEFDLISFSDSSDGEERRETAETVSSGFSMYEGDSDSEEELTNSGLEICPWNELGSDYSSSQDSGAEMTEEPSILSPEASDYVGTEEAEQAKTNLADSVAKAFEATDPTNGKAIVLPNQHQEPQTSSSEVDDVFYHSWNFGKKPKHIDLRRPMPALPPRKRRKVRQQAEPSLAFLQRAAARRLQETRANKTRTVTATPVQNTCIPFEPSFLRGHEPCQKILVQHYGDITEELCSTCHNILSRDFIMDEAPELEKDDVVMIDIVTCIECTMQNTSQWEEVFVGVGISEEHIMVGTTQWDEYITGIDHDRECIMTGTMEWDTIFREWLDSIPVGSAVKKQQRKSDDDKDIEEDYSEDESESDDEEKDYEEAKRTARNRIRNAKMTIKKPPRHNAKDSSRRKSVQQQWLAFQALQSLMQEKPTKKYSSGRKRNFKMKGIHRNESTQRRTRQNKREGSKTEQHVLSIPKSKAKSERLMRGRTAKLDKPCRQVMHYLHRNNIGYHESGTTNHHDAAIIAS